MKSALMPAQYSTEQNIAELGSWGLWLPFKQVERSTNETLVSGDPRAKESMDWNDNARDCRKQWKEKKKNKMDKSEAKPWHEHLG